MPLTSCPKCGEDTLTIAGWADVDHCPFCGEVLVPQPPRITGINLPAGSAANTEREPDSMPMPRERDAHAVAL